MATDLSPQRAYRAACPNCGAPVEFRSATSAFAVCSFCKSTLVRDGDALRRIGQSAELFDDHTPLQIGTSGSYQGERFTLVGRLQHGYADGVWNEWHALFDAGGRSGWLAEDNGRYVFAFDAPLNGPAPPAANLASGARLVVDGRAWSVGSVVETRLLAAAGELPIRPQPGRSFIVVDLRNPQGEVGTLDYTEPAAPRWSIGRPVGLADLALQGLADVAEKTLSGRGLACPNCGAPLIVTLATTRSVVCPQCRSVVDLGAADGALAHYPQAAAAREPAILLGSVGRFAFDTGELPWQAVGYVERRELPEDADDAPSSWREYLLYHRTAGFAFLVDAEDGWSWSVPITGAPDAAASDAVRWQGVDYRRLYAYGGVITFVLGEFYWRLAREQRTANVDYAGTGAATARRLNREETHAPGNDEVVWSAGAALTADQVAAAFRTASGTAPVLPPDAAPKRPALLGKVVLWIAIILVVLFVTSLFDRDDRSDCDSVRASFGDASSEYRGCLNANRGGGGYGTGGGSFGGYSSGGGHK